MRRTPPLLLLLIVGLVGPLAARRAAAQEIPCSAGPCLRPVEVGTRFLAEVNGGGSLFGARGLAVGGIFGVGGQLRWLPLRFYAIAEFTYASSTEDGASPTLGASFRDARSHRDLGVGLRVYLPLGPVRLFADVLGGGSYLSGTIDRPDLPARAVSGWAPLGVAAVGLQVRIIRQLAVGMRARFVFTGDELDGLRATMGVASSRPVSFLGGLTWHF